MQDPKQSQRPHKGALVILALIMGANLAQPAVAHVTKKVGHLVKHLNPRYVNVGEKASDSDTLDGLDSLAFLKTGQKAADSDNLDGLDSEAFQRRLVRTLLTLDEGTVDNTISSTYEFLLTVGSFVKQRGSSVVQLTWTGHVTLQPSIDPNSVCDFQLRIDDESGYGDAGRAVAYTTDTPVSVTTVFGGLSTGPHTVSIWVRGFADGCWVNRGNFPQLFIVEEQDPTAPGGTL